MNYASQQATEFKDITVEDNIEGKLKHNSRLYPLSLHSTNSSSSTIEKIGNTKEIVDDKIDSKLVIGSECGYSLSLKAHPDLISTKEKVKNIKICEKIKETIVEIDKKLINI